MGEPNAQNCFMKLFKIEIDRNRVYGLDILRALAILFVAYGHGSAILGDHINKTIYYFPIFNGVVMFFVLSGFLIGGILLKVINQTEFNKEDLFNFWIRRWFRTLPNYYLVLMVLILWQLWLHFFQGGHFPYYVYKYLGFFQNFYSPHPVFFPEAWSLAVEEWFYLLIPAILYLSIRFTTIERRKIILFWILFIIVTVTLFRAYRAFRYDYIDIMDFNLFLRKQVITNLDSIMFGFLGAYLKYYKGTIWGKYKNIFFFMGLTLLIYPKIHSFAGSIFYRNYLSLSFTSLGTFVEFQQNSPSSIKTIPQSVSE